jgi:predicted nucleotidyltransferase
MKRNILQIPIKAELREKAEKEANDLGFSSLQEMIRVMLTQITNKKNEVKFEVDDICDKYGINYLGLFGSVARGEQTKNSDVDLLVKFDKKRKIGLFGLAEVQDEFERRLGRKVDLVTKINKYIKSYADKDLRTIYEKK